MKKYLYSLIVIALMLSCTTLMANDSEYKSFTGSINVIPLYYDTDIEVEEDVDYNETVNYTLSNIIYNINTDNNEALDNVPEELINDIKVAMANGQNIDIIAGIGIEALNKEDFDDDVLNLFMTYKDFYDENVMQYMDISLNVILTVNGEDKLYRLKKLDRPLKFSFILKDSYMNLVDNVRKFKILGINENNIIEVPNVLINNRVEMETDILTTYILEIDDPIIEVIEPDVEIEDVDDNNNIMFYVIGGSAVVLIGIIVFAILRKNKH